VFWSGQSMPAEAGQAVSSGSNASRAARRQMDMGMTNLSAQIRGARAALGGIGPVRK
jgi:hypothetical protein